MQSFAAGKKLVRTSMHYINQNPSNHLESCSVKVLSFEQLYSREIPLSALDDLL